jgi:hypothetical protein
VGSEPRKSRSDNQTNDIKTNAHRQLIQKVNDKVELNRSAPQTVLNP